MLHKGQLFLLQVSKFQQLKNLQVRRALKTPDLTPTFI